MNDRSSGDEWEVTGVSEVTGIVPYIIDSYIDLYLSLFSVLQVLHEVMHRSELVMNVILARHVQIVS